jgi:Recombinase
LGHHSQISRGTSRASQRLCVRLGRNGPSRRPRPQECGGLHYRYRIQAGGLDEADLDRRVFRAFAAGISPRAIARRLNEEGVAGPDGALWTDFTLRGHAALGTGLINNELYIGRLVWNRLRYVKDPTTGKRVSRLNPRDKWITTEVPELRIVDDELWQAAKARQAELAIKYAGVIEVTRAHRAAPSCPVPTSSKT